MLDESEAGYVYSQYKPVAGYPIMVNEFTFPLIRSRYPNRISDGLLPDYARSGITMKVNVNRQALIAKLGVNRTAHEKKFCEAYLMYEEIYRNSLRDRLDGTVRFDEPINIQKPTEFLDRYDTAIGMLTMAVDETVELTADQYRSYVEDKWEWSSLFERTTMSYTA